MIKKTTVTLNPGEATTVAFTFTPSAAGVHSVSVDGLSGSFAVLEPAAAEFEVTNLVIEPAEVFVNQSVSISVTVANIGNARGSYTVTFEVT